MKAKSRYKAATSMALLTCMPLLALGVTACTTAPPIAEPAFDGDWWVEWCDKTAPNVDCGGFGVRLVQTGDRLCGSYSGATVGLRQIDEGNGAAILGKAGGERAELTIRSGRNGALSRVHARVIGDRLVWDEYESIEPGRNDVAVTGGTTVLQRVSGPRSVAYSDAVEDCASASR